MNLLPFGDLPRPFPRRIVPSVVDLGDWCEVSPIFDLLAQRLSRAGTLPELELWLRDWGELTAALDEAQARRYIAMTCHTESVEAERAYRQFVEQVEPPAKKRHCDLERAYLGHPLRPSLPGVRYGIFDRNTVNHVSLFREANVALESAESRLGQQYNKLSGSMTVTFRGEEKTLVQMGRHLEDTDRLAREEAWRLVAERRWQDRDRFESLCDDLVALRSRMAGNADCGDFRGYAFRKLGRFDYTPEDCERFHEAIEQEVMPALRVLQQERREHLGLGSLRPWDLAVDPMNRPPLRPFETVDGLLAGAQRIFDRLDSGLGSEFRSLQGLRLLDLGNRRGKAPGGYLQPLSESRQAFIFMNAIGVQRDVETLTHEAGHAFHALAVRDEEFQPYRGAPIEFCEVASMSMELLANEFVEEFYPAPEARRARRHHLEGVLNFFPWMAAIDAFQHWVYTHPGHSREDRSTAWQRLMDRFGGTVDWTGLEDFRSTQWHRQLHLYLYPFYYVEYGIAQLGALQVWANYRRDPAESLAAYRAALALGGSCSLPELFATAGCRFDLSRKTLAPLIRLVREELARLG